MPPNKESELKTAIEALTALDNAIQALIDLDLDSRAITAFAKSSADIMIGVLKKQTRCMNGQCQQMLTETVKHKIGSFLNVELSFCAYHKEEYDKVIQKEEKK